MNSRDPSSVLKEAFAADLLGLSPRTLQRLRQEGGGPPFIQLTERRVGYATAAIEDWLRQRTVASTSAATAAAPRKTK